MFEGYVNASLKEIAQRVWTETIEWTYADVSRASGVSGTTVKKFVTRETRSPHYSTVAKIAKAIGVDISFKQTTVVEQPRPKLRVVSHRKAARKIKLRKAS